jgi:hypothetical protein
MLISAEIVVCITQEKKWFRLWLFELAYSWQIHRYVSSLWLEMAANRLSRHRDTKMDTSFLKIIVFKTSFHECFSRIFINKFLSLSCKPSFTGARISNFWKNKFCTLMDWNAYSFNLQRNENKCSRLDSVITNYFSFSRPIKIQPLQLLVVTYLSHFILKKIIFHWMLLTL